MKVIISTNPYRDNGLAVARETKQVLERAGAQAVICLPFLPRREEKLQIPEQVILGDLQTEMADADMLVCLGGDGTILHAARDAAHHNIPILGVNLGSVGFMAELERDEIEDLAQIVEGSYTIEERMMLHICVRRGNKVIAEDLALNDAVFSKCAAARVAEVEVLTDGAIITKLMGDGVIVATPTGSTAYSMSAGGPIVEPTSRGIIITPVCAHHLTARSMVLASRRTIVVRIPKESRKNLHLSVDGGKILRLSGNETVEISRASQVTRLVRLKQRNFYELLNQKLGGYRT